MNDMLTTEDTLRTVDDITKELQFLRYFYDQAGYAFGPADADVYQGIKESYEGELPEGY